MRITALQQKTKLSQTYYLETDSTVSGCIVTVLDLNKEILGQFTSKRKKIGDNRPVENIVAYSPKMVEVLQYFNKVA